MQRIDVVYHREDGSWWAESDEMPGFSALAIELAQVRTAVRSEAEHRFGDGVVLVEADESGALIAGATGWLTNRMTTPVLEPAGSRSEFFVMALRPARETQESFHARPVSV